MSDEQIIAVITKMGESGIPLTKACAQAKINYQTVINRIHANSMLKEIDARSRQDYMRLKVRDLNEIAVNEPDVARARLMCDNIKWEAARVCRNEYGDKVVHEGSAESPIRHKIEMVIVDPKDQ